METRTLDGTDVAALRAFLLRDPCRHVYLVSILHWYGIAGPRARFTGAFTGGRLVGVLAEGREVHLWFASVAADEPRIAAALAPALARPRVAVLLGDEALTGPLLDALPASRRGGVLRMAFSASSGEPRPPAELPVRLAVPADLPALVDLYDGYETDGYPTRRHLRRALAERIRWTAIFVLDHEGRPVAAERVDAGSPEVWMFGGLTTRPDHRGRGLGRAVRLAANLAAERAGIPTCGIRDPRNALHRNSYDPTVGSWLIASLRVPAPARWQRALAAVRARLSPWDRPCVRRASAYLPEAAGAEAPR